MIGLIFINMFEAGMIFEGDVAITESGKKYAWQICWVEAVESRPRIW
jgi:hypothetical protein